MMKHFIILQTEFLKQAIKWNELPLEKQKAYLNRHHRSKRRLMSNKIKITNDKQVFSTNEGTIDFAKVKDKYEFIDENNPFWDKASDWVEIDTLRANEKFKGKGSILLQKFIRQLPNNTGIVLNATPLDGDISFKDLQDWYKKHGFRQINKDNISLYRVK